MIIIQQNLENALNLNKKKRHLIKGYFSGKFAFVQSMIN